jgi:large subunit ribosomal protein L22
MVNTEKPTGKTEQKKNVVNTQTKKADKKILEKAPVKTEENKIENSTEKSNQDNKEEEKSESKKIQTSKVKRDIAVVNAKSVEVSTKYSVAICKFIKGKRIGDAIRELEDVTKKKIHVPMIGEYGHKHGSGKFASGAGRYPVNASKQFIKLLKGLSGNANANEMNEPYVAEASASKASRPMGRFGRWERKRTHIKLVAKEMKIKNKEKKKSKKKAGGKK